MAWAQLAELLERKNRNRKRRLVVFIDELPCFDTHRSGFLQALDLFWNSRASWIDNIYFVVCGSATSWMMRNIVNNKAGLHKRATHTMHLRPFSLGQAEEYLKSRKFRWPRIAVLNIVKGKGCKVWDDKGQEYLDLYGGHAVISIGHAHPHYIEKVTEQIGRAHV